MHLISKQLVVLQMNQFISHVFDLHCAHLAHFWAPLNIEHMEDYHCAMLHRYRDELASMCTIDACDHNDIQWCLGLFQGQFHHLSQNLGRLMFGFANSISIESNFSIWKWEDIICQSLSNLSLEGIFQSKLHTCMGSIWVESANTLGQGATISLTSVYMAYSTH